MSKLYRSDQERTDDMPAKSKAQFKFFKAVESGKVKLPGVGKRKARDWTQGVKVSRLPERKKK